MNQKGKKDDKKKPNPKNSPQQSKFIANKSTKAAAGGMKKGMTGGSQRGS